MFTVAVGNVVAVDRHIKDTKLSTVRLAQNYSGVTVEDGKWGSRDTGFFTYQVWEDNTMAGTNSNFVKTMDSLKPGATVEILAELTDRTTKTGGETSDRRITLTALRIGFVQTAKPQGDEKKVGAVGQQVPSPPDQDGFFDVEGEEEEGYVPDAFS